MIYDYYFKKDFTGEDGSSYSLYFYPGYEADYSSPTTQDFPVGTILEGLTIKRSFSNDLPMGIEDAVTMEFEVDLSRFVGSFSGENWSDVQRAILRGQSENPRTISYGVLGDIDLYIPNRWALFKDGSLVYEGYQEVRADLELNINLDPIETKYKITVTDNYHYLSKMTTLIGGRLWLMALSNKPATTKNIKHSTDALYKDNGIVFGFGKTRNDNIGYCTKQALYESFNDYFDELTSYINRGTVSGVGLKQTTNFTGTVTLGSYEITANIDGLSVGMTILPNTAFPAGAIITGFTSNTIYTNIGASATVTDESMTATGIPYPDGNMTYYKPSETKEHILGDRIHPASILIPIETQTDGLLYGVYSKGTGELNAIGGYNSLYDFFQDETFGNANKGVLSWSGIGGNKWFLGIYRMLDYINTATTFDADKVLTDEIKITIQNKKYGTIELIPSNKYSESEDKITAERGSESDNSITLNPYFQVKNYVPKYDRTTSYNDMYFQEFEKMIISNYFYETTIKGDDWVNTITFANKLHNYARITIGNGYSNSTYTAQNLPVYVKEKSQRTNYNTFCKESQSKESDIIELLDGFLNDHFTAMIEVTTTYDIDIFGERFTIDPTVFEVKNYILTIGGQPVATLDLSDLGTTAICVGCERDVKKNTNKIKLWLYK